MLSRLAQTISRVNQLATAPFQAKLSIWHVAAAFIIVLLLATQWRLIVDKIEEYEP